MAMISADHITVKLHDKVILKDISLTIERAKRTVIIGPNGSGKSTLLKVLAGLLRYTSGTVQLDDKELKNISRATLAKQLAILPQGSETPKDLTVGELVEYGRFPHRTWWRGNLKEDAACINLALKKTGMEQFRSRFVRHLSGGERQRAWIAMALAQNPKLLLLDEPTTYLDIAHQLEILELVSELNDRNDMSVIMVLHDIQHAMKFSDEIIVLKEGRVFAQGKPQAVITAEMLEKVFGVSAEIYKNQQGQEVFVPSAIRR
ncbi:ABC transporter ATP-binding protein [Anaerosinus massiliensis]|uniref:ABC transporter ATP-binding protein n=1 Tax=Massilibacillus massiliensis TaxID=1806837 RepID=UPI000DA5F154|nr:ABC transporter ATP-binding protein [Massilibacillus massiliensis]